VAVCQWPWCRIWQPSPFNLVSTKAVESTSGLVAAIVSGVGIKSGVRRSGLSAENSVRIWYLWCQVHPPQQWRWFQTNGIGASRCKVTSRPSWSLPGIRQRQYLPLTSQLSSFPACWPSTGRPLRAAAYFRVNGQGLGRIQAVKQGVAFKCLPPSNLSPRKTLQNH